MVLNNILDLNDISRNLVGEDIDSILEKAYCTILFTPNYAIKLFIKNKREYDDTAIYHEYLWNKDMPLLQARLVDNIKFDDSNFKALVLKRIPYFDNVLYKLVYGYMRTEDIVNLGKRIKCLTTKYPQSTLSSDDLYNNFLSNLRLQIKNLGNKISPSTLLMLENIVNRPDIVYLFRTVGQKHNSVFVHGNLFTGNIFYHQGQLIVIDPISYKHVARQSFSLMDLATFLVDIKIFRSDNDYRYIRKELLSDFKEQEVYIVQLYFVLKLMVRLRFAYIENNMNDSRCLDEYVNKIIISKCGEILNEELKDLLKAF